MPESRMKTAEELNLEVYNKVLSEFEEYKAKLLSMNSEDILKHALDYAVREEIVLALEYNELRARQAQALLKVENTLNEIFEKWERFENNRLDCVKTAIECKANEISRQEYIRGIRERKARERDAR